MRGMPRFAAATVTSMVVVIGLVAPGSAYPRPGRTDRVSVASDATEANWHSWEPSISGDGRYVAFVSQASSLIPGDANGCPNDQGPSFTSQGPSSCIDVFVRDRVTGTLERVSVAVDGTEGNGDSLRPAITPDGRFVAFHSYASNLVDGDTNAESDTFVHDRETGITERVSIATDGTEGDGPTWQTIAPAPPSISADGRYVAFNSWANLVPTNPPPLHNFAQDVFVRDRETGTTELISVNMYGDAGVGYEPSISADGRYVAFVSAGWPFTPEEDSNGTHDVFVRDRQTGTTERVSVDDDGTQGNDLSSRPGLSADGRFVVFNSFATNLVPGDTNTLRDVFVHDQDTGITERVSVTSDGIEVGDDSWSSGVLPCAAGCWPSISADGRSVAFHSVDPKLVPGDTNGTYDVFVHDRDTGITERASVASDGTTGHGGVNPSWPAISADGRFVALQSTAPDLVPGDTNSRYDVFVRDRGPAIGVGEVSLVTGEDGVSVAGWATFSGRRLASAGDPSDDAAPGAEDAGAELTGASVTYRPEEEDLLVRLRVASIPGLAPGTCVPGYIGCHTASTGAGAPGLVYGLRLNVDGARYEIRALRAGATGLPPAAPMFAAYRCDVVCVEGAPLTGGIGTTGREVLVSVPLSALEAEEGAALTGIHAFTALGEAAPGGVAPLDGADLPNGAIPAAQVSLGIAPADTPESEVVFDTPAALAGGAFSGSLDASALPPGEYEVWARACLGEMCGAASTPVSVE